VEHNYPVYIVIWFIITLLTLLVFTVIPKKMKNVEDKETKNSLFTILVVTGIPLLMISILGPAVFIIGDKNMDIKYKAVWGVLVSIFIIYFFVKQSRSRKSNG